MNRPKGIGAIAVDADRMLIGTQVLAAELQVCQTTIQNWIKAGLLPKPIKIGKHNRWLRSDIGIWLQARAQARQALLMPLATDPNTLRQMAIKSVDPSLGGRGRRKPRRPNGRPRKIRESEK